MLRTNADKLPMMGVQGTSVQPMVFDILGLSSDETGYGNAGVSMGGIVYNFQTGDCCMGIQGDHVEASVSSCNTMGDKEHLAYMTYACLGNTARVLTGPARGRIGYVAGKHGTSQLMLQFEDDVLNRLTYHDRFLIRAWGVGLELTDYPEIKVMNIAPDLLQKIGIREENGELVIPVAKRLPAAMLGSGIGHNAYVGDYDLECSDWQLATRLGLDELRFGDFVEITDADCTVKRGYHKGAVTIGVVIHSDSYIMGHGPGIMNILSCREPKLRTELDEGANLANYMK